MVRTSVVSQALSARRIATRNLGLPEDIQSVDRVDRKQAFPAALFDQLVYMRIQNPIIPLVLWD
jgi:hypothetical protein